MRCVRTHKQARIARREWPSAGNNQKRKVKQISESTSESNVKINKTENVRQKIIKRHVQKYGPFIRSEMHAKRKIKKNWNTIHVYG